MGVWEGYLSLNGTLRFLALAAIEQDPEVQGVLCLEEPENGIHPERIPKMLQLLQDIATDVQEPIGPDNPLRQVIINTHSPAVVSQVPDDSLLLAELKETVDGERIFKRVCFSCLSDTWREQAPEKAPIVSKGKLLSYLNPVASNIEPEDDYLWQPPQAKKRRVIDRDDLSQCSYRQQTPIKVPRYGRRHRLGSPHKPENQDQINIYIPYPKDMSNFAEDFL
ncbi:MAG TPA: ATP-binding protein [Oscillatoriaceae cyanobacterium M33_DOE_052]|uniref:ATP-binding protein n=1 Tax=Planktothricoides sp. SpSt-374 TaxID=2282167 RepID=A0A7C3ZQS3_9CYAN|nr:ATP-binding protein [Oscillatoriaceae cyanobacterium M33_DOE_052]